MTNLIRRDHGVRINLRIYLWSGLLPPINPSIQSTIRSSRNWSHTYIIQCQQLKFLAVMLSNDKLWRWGKMELRLLRKCLRYVLIWVWNICTYLEDRNWTVRLAFHLMHGRRAICMLLWPSLLIIRIRVGAWFVILWIFYYSGSNARFITEELLIDFRELHGEHSGKNVAEAIWETLVMYGIEGRVVMTCCSPKLTYWYNLVFRSLHSCLTTRQTMTHLLMALNVVQKRLEYHSKLHGLGYVVCLTRFI